MLSYYLSATLWGQCLKALGKNNTGNIYVMYMFINDANGGVHFTGYQSTSPSRVIYGRAHNGFLGAVSPEQLNVPPGKCKFSIIYLSSIFMSTLRIIYHHKQTFFPYAFPKMLTRCHVIFLFPVDCLSHL